MMIHAGAVLTFEELLAGLETKREFRCIVLEGSDPCHIFQDLSREIEKSGRKTVSFDAWWVTFRGEPMRSNWMHLDKESGSAIAAFTALDMIEQLLASDPELLVLINGGYIGTAVYDNGSLFRTQMWQELCKRAHCLHVYYPGPAKTGDREEWIRNTYLKMLRKQTDLSWVQLTSKKSQEHPLPEHHR